MSQRTAQLRINFRDAKNFFMHLVGKLNANNRSQKIDKEFANSLSIQGRKSRLHTLIILINGRKLLKNSNGFLGITRTGSVHRLACFPLSMI